MLGYEEMCERLSALEAVKGAAVRREALGMSRACREIPLLRIGNAEAPRSVLYVGTHHALEAITAELLLRFAEEIVLADIRGGCLFNINVRNLLQMRRLIVVPMLNPDGVELVIHGVESAGSFGETAAALSDGDFSAWQANAIGVDLNHNYDAGFADYKAYEVSSKILPGASLYSGEYPESEPETAALAELVRHESSLASVMALHTQGEELYTKAIYKYAAEYLARISGYKHSVPSGTALFGGFSDYVGDVLHIPAVTLECGRGRNPLPDGDATDIYLRIRELLVRFSVLY